MKGLSPSVLGAVNRKGVRLGLVIIAMHAMPLLCFADTVYAVIANSETPGLEAVLAMDAAARKQLTRQLMLKQRSTWPSGIRALPIGRPIDDSAEIAFAAHVLEMSMEAVSQHWVRAKQISGATPPRRIARDKWLLKFMERKVASIAVVSYDSFQRFGNSQLLTLLFTFVDEG